MARLVLLSEGLTGRTYELKVEKSTVGRVADNTLEIPEPSISSHHCELVLKGSEVLVKDLNSTNGTFINGEKISEGVLKSGNILRLGLVDMRLETGDAGSVASKKPLDQTRAIPQGVKLDELEGTRPVSFEGKKGFEKKSNKGTKIFIGAVVVVGVFLVGLLIYIVSKR